MKDRAQLDAFEWRQLIDGATDTAIISTNRNGEITCWNAGADSVAVIFAIATSLA